MLILQYPTVMGIFASEYDAVYYGVIENIVELKMLMYGDE